eukprot:scaffold11152_cov57-Phaeocystis_antarctica.AAC.2
MPCCLPWPLRPTSDDAWGCWRQPLSDDGEEVLHSGELFLRSWNGHVEAWQHGQSAHLGSARGRLLRLLRARLAALGGSTLSGEDVGPLGAPPLPQVLARASRLLSR